MDEPSEDPEASPSPAPFFRAIHRALGDVPSGATVLFSGGVDSGLLAFCLRELDRRPRLLVGGVDGAPDLAAARAGAEALGLELEVRRWTPSEVRPGVAGTSDVTASWPEPIRSVRLSLVLVLREVRGRTAVLGQGADELFGGYARYAAMDRADRGRAMAEDLRRLREIDWPWTEGAARSVDATVVAPFLDGGVAAAVSEALVQWPDGSRGKRLLRRWSREHGLPPAIAGRPKKAIQYGAGVRRAIPSDRGAALPAPTAGPPGSH